MEVFVSPSSVPFPVNYSSVVPVGCDGDLHRNSCMLNDTEVTYSLRSVELHTQ